LRSRRRRSLSLASTIRSRDARSSASSRATWLRRSPPRNANGSSDVAIKAAHQAASPAPDCADVTSRNVSIPHT
jgi:hypothetical protein